MAVRTQLEAERKKWMWFLAAALFAAFTLISFGAPPMPVWTGVALVGVGNLISHFRRH